MYYVIIDLEWNQYHNPLRTPTSRAGVKMHEEIIQIGAVKTDHDLNPVDTFQLYVRLGNGRRLDRYVKKLTHITESNIASGEDFPVASEEFAAWLSDVDAIFSWGADDRRVFLNNLAFHSLEAPAIPWFDAQRIYARQIPGHGSLGLKNIAQEQNVYVNLTLHDALNDAILTGFCMRGLDLKKGIEEYNNQKESDGNGEPQPIASSKTHRHPTQQAAWDEACMSLLRCPDCMQSLVWSGDEVGSLERWFKPAQCKTHGEYIIKGEFIGQKYSVVRFSFYKPTDDVKEMIKKAAEPQSKKRRRRRKKKTADAQEPAVQPPEDVLSRAIAFAAEKHKLQTRKGGAIPYIVHPMEAAAITATMTDDMLVIAASMLHDTVEDCPDVTMDVIENSFGAHIADLVAFETEEKTENASESWRARKEDGLKRLKDADEEHLIVALADKLSNARAMHIDYLQAGDELFKRFNQTDKSEQAWYYHSLVDALATLSRFPAYAEFQTHVEAVFGKKKARRRKPSKTK